MVDVVRDWWGRIRPERAARDERGTTALEWVMVAGLCLSAVVLVGSLGASWVGNV
jgi:Flp pilus assembly pilin Flp